MSVDRLLEVCSFNISEISKLYLFISLVFYGLETCVKNAQVHDEGGMSYIVRLD